MTSPASEIVDVVDEDQTCFLLFRWGPCLSCIFLHQPVRLCQTMAHNSVSPIDEGKYKTIKGTTKPIKSSLKDTDSHISDETSNKFRELDEHLDLLLEPMEASDDEQAVKDGLDASDDDEHLATMHRQYTQPENMHHASGEVLQMAEDDLEDPLFPNKQLPPKKRISNLQVA